MFLSFCCLPKRKSSNDDTEMSAYMTIHIASHIRRIINKPTREIIKKLEIEDLCEICGITSDPLLFKMALATFNKDIPADLVVIQCLAKLFPNGL